MAEAKTNIADRLLGLIRGKQNPCIVGLDPRIDFIPDCMRGDDDSFEAVRDAFIRFNTKIIDAVCDIVPAVKLQMAFYEQYGSHGLEAFRETARRAREKGLIVIEDAKRNDIGSTAEAYANGHLGEVRLSDGSYKPSLDVDFITVTPYLGSDGIEPFVEVCRKRDKGILILVKTSNPSSGELQDKIVPGEGSIYEVVARYVAEVGEDFVGNRGYSAVGAVVGATYPAEAARLREIMKRNIFLVPGYGAQGGEAQDVVPCFNEDGLGAVVSSSRGIIYAYSRKPYCDEFSAQEFHLASRQAAIDMRDSVCDALKMNEKLPR